MSFLVLLCDSSFSTLTCFFFLSYEIKIGGAMYRVGLMIDI
jgi:hypothetical protein